VGDARAFLEQISKSQNFEGYRQVHWHCTCDQHLDVVRKEPRVTRTAYQRLYDMILSYRVVPVEGSKDGPIGSIARWEGRSSASLEQPTPKSREGLCDACSVCFMTATP
jgi:hypothetical protein